MFPQKASAVSVLLLLLLIPYSDGLSEEMTSSSVSGRKLLRYWGWNTCSADSLSISQGPTGTLPNGIPAYSVTISNTCVTGNSISDIHVHCGWFASTRLIDPSIFRRLGYDDCLVNDGRPLESGDSIHFQYTNSFLYRLSVASAKVDS